MTAKRHPPKAAASTPSSASGRAAEDDFYPYSDGKPMAESPEHIDALIRSFQMLQDRYAAEADVYVGADMFLYYEHRNRAAAVAPDVFVAKGVAKARHRTSYRLWEEGTPPSFVLELTSPSTTAEDQRKRSVYERIGVAEYVLYDPSSSAFGSRRRRLRSAGALQGYRLGPDGYAPIAVAAEGGLVSHQLGLRLAEEDGRLEWYDVASGLRLLDRLERIEAEAAARQTLETRLAELEARLREGGPPARET